MAYSRDPDAYRAALAIAQPTRLHVVTPGPPPVTPPCTGGYTCQCPDCLSSAARPRNRNRARQPWEARPSRHARAA